MMQLNPNDYSLEELLAAEQQSQKGNVAPLVSPENSPEMPAQTPGLNPDDYSLEELMAAEQQANAPQQPAPWQDFLKGFVATGPASLVDILAEASKSHPVSVMSSMIDEKHKNSQIPEVSFTNTASKKYHEITGFPEGEPGIAQTAGEFLSPVPGLSKFKASKEGFKAAGKALAGALGASTAVHQLPNITQKGSVPENIAKAMIGSSAGHGVFNAGKAIGNAKNYITKKGMTESEKKISAYIRNTMGEENLEKALASIEKSPKYEMTGYRPMTAEIAGKESPIFAQLHRLEEGRVGSGIPEQTNIQNKSLERQFSKQSAGASSSHEIKTALENELTKRKDLRNKETSSSYEAMKNIDTPASKGNIEKFLDETVERGDLEKDLNDIRKMIQPRHKLTADEKSYKEFYDKASKSAREKLETPKATDPNFNELEAAYRAINRKIEDAVSHGKGENVVILTKARNALEKDLEPFAIHKETTKKYQELSNPVNDILEHRTMKNVSSSKSNNLYEKLFDQNSADNLKQLKKVLGQNSREWEGIQHGVVDHLKRSISNRGEVFSYDKFHKFFEKHKNALETVLTPDQMKFVTELKSALHGRDIAAGLGAGKGSPTAHHLMNAMGLNAGIGTKLLTGASYIPEKLKIIPYGKVAGASFRFMLNRAAKNKQIDVMAALDNILKNPEEASRILKMQFKSQTEFNKYLQALAPTSVTSVGKAALPHMTIHLREKDKEKNNE